MGKSNGERRRRKSDDLFWAEGIAAMTTILVAFSILIPAYRTLIMTIGAAVIVLGIIAALGYVIFKSITTNDESTAYRNWKTATTTTTATATQEPIAPSTTGHISSRADLSRRSFNEGGSQAKADTTQSRPMPYVLPSEYVPHIKPEIRPIDRLRDIDWFQFERFVAYIYEKRGFKVTPKGGANPDGGIDLVIEKRENGERFGVQCKQWKSWNVGVRAIREFLGALTDSKIQKGIFITLEGYTDDAKQLADKHAIEIINETGLRRLAEGLDLHDPKVAEILSDTRKFCPKCEREMVKRTPRKGGEQFWGCSTYPRCHFMMPI